MGIKDMIARWRSEREEMSDFERQKKIERKWLEKQKSSNERELERYLEEQRQAQIKSELEFMRKKRDKDFNSHKILEEKNIFKGGHNEVLKDNKKLYNNNNKLLKGRYLFK